MTTLTETIKKMDPYLASLQEKANDIFSKIEGCLNQYQSIIGVDLGTSAVKGVEFTETRGQWLLTTILGDDGSSTFTADSGDTTSVGYRKEQF